MKNPIDAHVGKRLRHRRWLVGMTQQQLGDAVGIKFQQIQKYETGMNRISASRLWDLARVLDVPVAFFFEGIGVEHADATAVAQAQAAERGEGDVLRDKETVELVRAYYAIPEDQRRKLLDLTKALGKDA